MKESRLDILSFKRDSKFYGELNLVLTVKSFDLQTIRKRYVASRKNENKKTGSVERRLPSNGGIVSVKLSNGALKNQTVHCSLKEPRGIHIFDQKLALAAENIIYIFDEENIPAVLSSPWFSYIHTVQFHPKDTSKVLISSSGFDLIQEYNYKTKELTFEWLAWENGFDKARDPKTGEEIILTRDPQKAHELNKNGVAYSLISDPAIHHLPTAKRAAFINSVTYHPETPNYLLATFFHEGAVYKINKLDKSSRLALKSLKNPHGGHIVESKIIATSTASGEVFVYKKDGLLRLDFKNLPCKPADLDGLEWIQNTLSLDHLLVAIDSNRTSFVIIDPQEKLYDMIPYEENWAVQDMVSGKLTNKQQEQLSLLHIPSN